MNDQKKSYFKIGQLFKQHPEGLKMDEICNHFDSEEAK